MVLTNRPFALRFRVPLLLAKRTCVQFYIMLKVSLFLPRQSFNNIIVIDEYLSPTECTTFLLEMSSPPAPNKLGHL